MKRRSEKLTDDTSKGFLCRLMMRALYLEACLALFKWTDQTGKSFSEVSSCNNAALCLCTYIAGQESPLTPQDKAKHS